MNKNINLTEILKDCPEGTKFYSTIFGDVEFMCITDIGGYSIVLKARDDYKVCVDSKGRYLGIYNGECILFPSREQRDWNKFTAPWYKKEKDSLQTNDREWLYLVSDVLTWKNGIGQYLDNPRVQNLAKRLCREYAQKLYNPSNTEKNEQKSADKIEPKFKVGDWVVNKFGDSYHIDSLDKKNYQISDRKGNYNYFPISQQDKMHLWTIQDAKDGDVLAISWWEDKNLWEKIIIFKKYHNEGVKGLYSMPCIEGYGNTFKNVKIAFTDEEVPYYSKTWTYTLLPATQRQRDVLMKAMNDAGYEWDAEKKELKLLVSNQDNRDLVPDKKEKFEPKELSPFDKVLARDDDSDYWSCQLFSYIVEDEVECPYACVSNFYNQCIPYNDETKHLVGRTDKAPEFYRYWED